jgi:hypothetical protein
MRFFWGILGLLLLALPIRADALYDVSGTATLTGNDTCGGVCVETINFAFQLDEHPLTCADLNAFECQDPTGAFALLANDLTITASGPLGAAPLPGNGAFVDDKFMGITFGGDIRNEFDLLMNPFPPPGFPFTPTGIGGYLYNCATANCFGFCPFINTGPGNCDSNENHERHYYARKRRPTDRSGHNARTSNLGDAMDRPDRTGAYEILAARKALEIGAPTCARGGNFSKGPAGPSVIVSGVTAVTLR